MKKLKKIYCRTSLAVGTITLILALALSLGHYVHAANANANTNQTQTAANASSDNNNGISVQWGNGEGDFSGNLRILLVLTVISLAPSILIMLTSFTRIIIVLHFVRNAVGTQTAPPNQVLVGLALFLTLFIMSPIFTQINETAIKPFDAGEISQEEALETGLVPLRKFMYEQTQRKDLELFCDIAGVEDVDYKALDVLNDKELSALDTEELRLLNRVPITVVIPSFILSELRSAFIMGFLIYIPFIVIDMVVASVLMSMGMMMLPPTTISLPFKVLLFILADGWNLVIGNLVKTFY